MAGTLVMEHATASRSYHTHTHTHTHIHAGAQRHVSGVGGTRRLAAHLSGHVQGHLQCGVSHMTACAGLGHAAGRPGPGSVTDRAVLLPWLLSSLSVPWLDAPPRRPSPSLLDTNTAPGEGRCVVFACVRLA